jgi:hypothetical protein
MKKSMALAAVALAATMTTAVQAQTIDAHDLLADFTNPLYDSSFSVGAYSPWTTHASLDLKTQDGFTGVGVHGMTNGEIDWREGRSESISVSFAHATRIDSFTLGLLFNGPEYNDVREVASIRLDGDTTAYTLRASGTENVARWYHGSSFLGSVSYLPGAGTQFGEAGALTLFNPFGDRAVNSITFAAAQGSSGGLCGWSGLCTNQSDYNVVAIAPAVPEPETYALMLAGLAAIAVMRRRGRRDY